MSLRVLGLDLSYTAVGVARTHHLDVEQVAVREQLGVRTITSGSRRGDERVHHIVGEIREELRWQPQLAVIERPFVKHNNTTIALAELHGVVKRELYLHDVRYVYVAATTLKVYATGRGDADKDLVVHMMRARHGEALGGPSRLQTNDEADALALLALALHAYGQPLVPVPAEAARAVKEERWPTLSASTSPVALDFASIARPEGALL